MIWWPSWARFKVKRPEPVEDDETIRAKMVADLMGGFPVTLITLGQLPVAQTFMKPVSEATGGDTLVYRIEWVAPSTCTVAGASYKVPFAPAIPRVSMLAQPVHMLAGDTLNMTISIELSFR